MFVRSGRVIVKKNVRGIHSYSPMNKIRINVSQNQTPFQFQAPFQNVQSLTNSSSLLRLYSTQSSENSDEKTERTEEESNQQEKPEEETKEQTEEEQKIVQLTEEIAKLKDSYARCLADQENTRRIARQDVKNATEYAITKMAKNVLDVADNLDRALGVIHPEDFEQFMQYFQEHHDEALKKRANQMKSIVSGVQLTRKVLMKSLESNGISQIEDAAGKKFDPEFHEALMKQSTDDMDKVGQVAHVINQGYTIKDRILRPAKVVVFVDPDAE